MQLLLPPLCCPGHELHNLSPNWCPLLYMTDWDPLHFFPALLLSVIFLSFSHIFFPVQGSSAGAHSRIHPQSVSEMGVLFHLSQLYYFLNFCLRLGCFVSFLQSEFGIASIHKNAVHVNEGLKQKKGSPSVLWIVVVWFAQGRFKWLERIRVKLLITSYPYLGLLLLIRT